MKLIGALALAGALLAGTAAAIAAASAPAPHLVDARDACGVSYAPGPETQGIRGDGAPNASMDAPPSRPCGALQACGFTQDATQVLPREGRRFLSTALEPVPVPRVLLLAGVAFGLIAWWTRRKRTLENTRSFGATLLARSVVIR